MKHLFDSFREALQRAPTPERKKCSFGKFPRHGKVARRGDDCLIDCADFTACEKANMEGGTLEDK